MKPGVIHFEEDEEVVGMVRRSLLVEAPRFAFALLWFLLPFFFLFPLLQLGSFGLMFFGALVLSGAYALVRTWLVWRYTMLLITDRRVVDIDQLGVFERRINELSLNDVSQAVCDAGGPLRRLAGIGVVTVETIEGHAFDLEISGVKRPQHVCDLIHEVQYLARGGNGAKQRYAKTTIAD